MYAAYALPDPDTALGTCVTHHLNIQMGSQFQLSSDRLWQKMRWAVRAANIQASLLWLCCTARGMLHDKLC